MSLLTRELGKASLAAEKAARLVACPDPYRTRFHLCPPVGWLSDPNGLCQLDGVYHGYFQYSPLDAEGSLKMWGHATSEDLVVWDYKGVAIFADQWFDCHGAYTGSALVEDGVIKVLYTGNVKLEDRDDYNYIDNGRLATQIYAESIDGETFGRKVPVLAADDYPEGLTCHVRDPKLWIEEDPEDGSKTYYMVLGARRRGPRTMGDVVSIELSLGGRPIEMHAKEGAALVDQGEVLVYRSKELNRGWELVAQVSTPEPFGYMWECPDWFLLPAGDDDPAEGGATVGILSLSPQGLKGAEWERRNTYQAGYLRFEGGLLDGGLPTEFHLWDEGFDYYAPQSFVDEAGRRILIGWVGVPDTPEHACPTLKVEDAWQHCFSLPREVVVEDGIVKSRPVAELERYHGEKQVGDGSLSMAGEGCEAFDLTLDFDDAAKGAVKLTLAEELSIVHEEGRLTMRFSDTSKDAVGAGRDTRYEDVGLLHNLRVVGDTSTIEAFVNGGQHVFSTRYFPKKYSVDVDAPGAKIAFWPLVK